ncbi:MAG: hypothetical protein ACTSPG_02870 [Candidatus Hodarchaeales archaeon]
MKVNYFFKIAILWYITTGLVYVLELYFYYYLFLDFVDVYPPIWMYVVLLFLWPFFVFYSAVYQAITESCGFPLLFYILTPFIVLGIISLMYIAVDYYRKSYNSKN